MRMKRGNVGRYLAHHLAKVRSERARKLECGCFRVSGRKTSGSLNAKGPGQKRSSKGNMPSWLCTKRWTLRATGGGAGWHSHPHLGAGNF